MGRRRPRKNDGPFRTPILVRAARCHTEGRRAKGRGAERLEIGSLQVDEVETEDRQTQEGEGEMVLTKEVHLE
jgi:hypothetical protein